MFLKVVKVTHTDEVCELDEEIAIYRQLQRGEV